MPWKVKDVMSLRMEFVSFAKAPGAKISQLCRRFGISRKTGYKWLRRFDARGIAGLVDESRRPRHSPLRSPKKLEKAVLTLDLRRRTDRIHVLRFLGRVVVPASPDLARWLLEKMRSTEDSSEFEVLMDTLKARGVTPTDADLESVLKRWDRGRLKLGRKGLIRTLRWVSTGSFPITAQFLEQLIRNDSREVREAAARAALSISRKRRPSNI